MLVFTFYIYFFGKQKTHPEVLLAETSNFLRLTRFLSAKLVAGEANHHHLFAIFIVQCFQSFVLVGIAAFGSRIHAEYLCAFEVCKTDGAFLVETFNRKVVERSIGRGFHRCILFTGPHMLRTARKTHKAKSQNSR